MNETTLTQRLDDRNLLDTARNPGVYALQCAVPDAVDAVGKQWDQHHTIRPSKDTLQRLAAADRVAYVGASKDVYQRLCDHVTHSRRKASFVSAFNPERVVDVWPHSDPFEAEFNRAMRLIHDDWTVWTDGVLYG